MCIKYKMLFSNSNNQNVNNNNVEENIKAINTKKNEDSPMVILFYATWCGACNSFKPSWEQLEKKHPKEVVIGKVESNDYNNYEPSSNESNIEGYPTVRLYHKGKMIKEYDGDRSFRSLYKFVEEYIKQNKSVKKNNLVVVRSKRGNKMNTELVKKITNERKSAKSPGKKRKRTVSQRKSPEEKKGKKPKKQTKKKPGVKKTGSKKKPKKGKK